MDDLLLGPLGVQRRHPAPNLTLLLSVVALAGCGGGDEATDTTASLPMAGGGGSLTIAVPAVPDGVDPLTAEGAAELLAARQVHEPLVGPLRGPYGSSRLQAGLALSATPSSDRTVWTLELRSGVRFQDGSPFNASAVLANARRWLSLPQGRAALPDLFAVDAPHPNEVRFQLRSPDPKLPRRLRAPALGIVSPQALDPRSGDQARVLGVPETGTGPFEAGPRSASELNLSRNAAWWGSPIGLGPSLESIVFVRAEAERDRLRLLLAGEAQVAEPLSGPALAKAEADPLFDGIATDGGGLGIEASVRGLTGVVQPLSGVWLTEVGG